MLLFISQDFLKVLFLNNFEHNIEWRLIDVGLECLELVGLALSVSDSDLEENVSKIPETVGCHINRNNNEACQWISKNKWNSNSEMFLLKELPKYT